VAREREEIALKKRVSSFSFFFESDDH
jgi:hypothetical protein